MPRPSARPRLLAAAVELIVDDGPSALTYDRLAERAAVSKGGLLYHFPTKVELLGALVDEVLDRFAAAVDQRAATDDRPGAWAHAYVEASLDAEPSRPDAAVGLILASPDAGPELLRRCGSRMTLWHRRLGDDGLPGAVATTVRYACDGWWTLHALHVPGTTDDAQELRNHLHALIDEVLA